MKKLIIFYLFLLFGQMGFSQNPNYELILGNDIQTSSTVYEFDIIIQPLSPTTSFELASYECVISFNTSINSGSLSFSIVSGTSELLPSQQPTFVNIFGNLLDVGISFPPGFANGTIINGTKKIGRFRLTSSAVSNTLNANLNWVNGPSEPGTFITAYVNNSNTDITNPDNHIVNLVNPVLPVELSSFNVKAYGSLVELKWQTATEINNLGFDVERKSNNIEWKKVGFVEGNGNNNSTKNYSFTDKNLLGGTQFTYRLKQIDNDGKFSYSDEVNVVVVPDKFELFQNYPNPFNPSTKIKFALPFRTKVRLDVYNILGQKIQTLVDGEMEAGYHEVIFNASDLSNGTYIYRLIADNFSRTEKMLLVK